MKYDGSVKGNLIANPSYSDVKLASLNIAQGRKVIKTKKMRIQITELKTFSPFVM